MEIGTVHFWEAVLIRVLPPRSREHVLGDLHERRQYLRDAFLVVPAVIWSQVRRAADPLLLSATAVSIFSALIAAACLAPGTNPVAFFAEQAGLVRLAIVALGATAGVALADAYVNDEDRIVRACFSVAAACLINLTVSISPLQVVIIGVLLGTLMAVRVRRGLSSSSASQNQTKRPIFTSAAAVAIEAAKFQKTVRLRNLREYLGAVIVAAGFGLALTQPAPPVKRAACVISIIAALHAAWHIRKYGAAEPAPSIPEECVRFHRRQLIKQRELLNSVWRWYLGPLLIGPMTLFVSESVRSGHFGTFALIAAISLALYLWIGWLNTSAARRMQQQLDELNRLEI